MIKKIFRKLLPKKAVFLRKNGEEIKYKEYLKSEGMLLVESESGLEKIPISGLIRKKIER